MPILPETLVCPQCKQPLQQEKQNLICDVCQLAYPVNNGIPALIIEQTSKVGGQ